MRVATDPREPRGSKPGSTAAHSAEISLLALPLVLLAAAVISVPIARFARLSAIVAYLVAGVVIGPYGLGMFSAARDHRHGRRARRRDAAVPDRARAGAVAPARDAARHLRPRRRATCAHRRGASRGLRSRPACSTGAARWSQASRSRCRRPRSRCASWKSADTCSNPTASAHSRSCCSRTWRSCRCSRSIPLLAPGERSHRACDARRYRELRRARRARDRGPGRRRPLSAQSVLPPARLDRRARGDDRGGAAGRARRRAADAGGRHVDGARRVPRRRAARRNRTTATSSKPTSSRSAACCSRCSSWASA